ncbi:hypothetical protein [Bdellovibrio sp. HCB209]|uniref:hypothetical protein n=1 Tax=Bdellovibrio sp. HCB209 TaxID=3394354 RepID=UPI0039B3DE16
MMVLARALFLLLVFSLVQFALASSDADSRPIQANYQKLQIYEQIMNGDLPAPLPLPDDPAYPDPPQPPPSSPKPPYCSTTHPDNIRCIRAVCDQLPNMDCGTDKKVKDIACQCDGVNGQCVTAVCNQLDRFDCDEKRELFAITKMCRGVSDARCIDRICSELGRFECDDMNDMRRVTELCK